MPHVLIVDDDPTFCLMLKALLENNGFTVKEVFNAGSGLTALSQAPFDLVLTDFRLPDKDGIQLLNEIRKAWPGLPVILMTRYAEIRTAVSAIKLGAFEYVTKPVNPDELLLTIRKALELNAQGKPAEITPHKTASGRSKFQFIHGISPAAVKVDQYIKLVAPTDMSVIIQGESGTGKEYIARMIHQQSNRSSKPFVAVDCGALSKELAVSELFGHVKGSFTDASVDKVGQFQTANGGTLFLDEIGNLSYDIQLKLLRATQERSIRRIGSNKDIEIDVRILAATNENLDEAVQKGGFREDLFHRLNEFRINVPALRDRNEDISLFADHFLNSANLELNKSVKGFNEQVKQAFSDYYWPGNIREFRNVVRRAVLLASADNITLEQLPDEIIAPVRKEPFADIPAGESFDLKSMAEKNERVMILNILEKVHYNKSKAARLLNIDRKTLYNKMRIYSIEG
jgi:two-component system, NtrC family, response regulator HydG